MVPVPDLVWHLGLFIARVHRELLLVQVTHDHTVEDGEEQIVDEGHPLLGEDDNRLLQVVKDLLELLLLVVVGPRLGVHILDDDVMELNKDGGAQI